ncbi:MAG: nucleotidyltransferase, partial [Patescibacteria group bacterium]
MKMISSFLLMALIAHVDADCFYVSCERIRDSSLKGKPVGVLGNQGACVIARSYEMKAAGVTVAMPIWMAKKRCPDGIYVKRDFAWYEAVCLRTQEVLRRYSDYLEFYSVDETFLELQGVAMEDAERVAHEIQNVILKEIEVPVSIGIAPTRSLAKIASDKNKPFGISVVSPESHQEFLRSTPVSEICGVGRRLSVKLEEAGIHSCLDYVETPRERIKALLHKPGEEIWYELQGKPLLTVRTVRPQRKVLSRGGHIPGQSSDPEVVYGFFVRHLERLTEALIHYEVEILNLNVVLADAQGRYFSSLEALPDYSSDFALLL